MEVAAFDTFKTNVATGPYTALDSKPHISKLTRCSISYNLKVFIIPGFRFLLSLIFRVVKSHETCLFLFYYSHLKMEMKMKVPPWGAF